MSHVVILPALIAEVILYSEGFESSKNLAKKMVQMYKLCSEQLSQQDHYDFGMRAVKSVLVMAGALKRQNPDKNEDVVLIRALRDSNLPKFLKQDASLFQVGVHPGWLYLYPHPLSHPLHFHTKWGKKTIISICRDNYVPTTNSHIKGPTAIS